jgi:hypothetical protein
MPGVAEHDVHDPVGAALDAARGHVSAIGEERGLQVHPVPLLPLLTREEAGQVILDIGRDCGRGAAEEGHDDLAETCRAPGHLLDPVRETEDVDEGHRPLLAFQPRLPFLARLASPTFHAAPVPD